MQRGDHPVTAWREEGDVPETVLASRAAGHRQAWRQGPALPVPRFQTSGLQSQGRSSLLFHAGSLILGSRGPRTLLQGLRLNSLELAHGWQQMYTRWSKRKTRRRENTSAEVRQAPEVNRAGVGARLHSDTVAPVCERSRPTCSSERQRLGHTGAYPSIARLPISSGTRHLDFQVTAPQCLLTCWLTNKIHVQVGTARAGAHLHL